MAGKLSRIAQHGCCLLAAGLWLSVAASALGDENIRVSPTAKTLDNPFAAPARGTAGGRAAAAAAAPAVPATPPLPEAGPRMYQNPFAAQPGGTARGTSPEILPLGPGPISRWRQPIRPTTQIPLRTSALLDPVQRAPQPQGPVPAVAALPTQPPASQFSGVLDVMDLPAMAPAAPAESDVLAPASLGQPPWLLPKDEPAAPRTPVALRGPTARAPIDPFEATEPVDDGRGNAIRFVPPARDALTPASLAGAFDVDAVAADTELPPAEPPHDWLADAQKMARSADTSDELSALAALCRQGIAADADADQRAELRQLAAWAFNRRGELASRDGDPDAAIGDFQAALELDPTCWLALHNRAVSYAQQNRTAEALHDFNRVIAINPGLAVAYRNRGELLCSVDRTEEAVRDYTHAIDQLPGDAELYMMRGHAWHRLGHYEQALEDLNRSIELAPNRADAYAHRGNVHAERGDFHKAVNDFRRSLRLDPNLVEAYRSLAWLLATCPDPAVRDPEQAVAAARRAEALCAHDDCYVLDALAAAYASAGQFAKAVDYQQSALAAAPDDFAASLRERLDLYQQRLPYRNAPAAAVQPASYERKR